MTGTGRRPQEKDIPGKASAHPRARTGVVLLDGQERHDTGEHPESTLRLPAVIAHLQGLDFWAQLQVADSRAALVEDLARSHSEGYIEEIARAAAAGPTWLDGDTVLSAGSFEVARLASGAALTAVDTLLSDSPSRPCSMFALIRPPGHHALASRAMGFCLFNHASIAARYAQAIYGLQRVAIVDWDVHHGNGTQDIHLRDPSVLYISMHQWPLYPGTGWLDELGSGDGEGYNINLPMPPGCGDREYLAALEAVVEPVLRGYRPQLLIVSARQDCHSSDPLAGQRLSTIGLRRMAERMAAVARELEIGLAAVHEGGYNIATLPHADAAILAGFGDLPLTIDESQTTGGGPLSGFSERLSEIRSAAGAHWSELR
jgi:acetoin utilization deacetylase AcuC-like enzyme